MSFHIIFGLKELGGFPIVPIEKPAVITIGSSAKFECRINDAYSKPLTITNYSCKLEIKKADGSVLQLSATPIDNVKGEVEFSLTAADSALLKLDDNQSVELVIQKVSDPNICSIHVITSALSVRNQAVI